MLANWYKITGFLIAVYPDLSCIDGLQVLLVVSNTIKLDLTCILIFCTISFRFVASSHPPYLIAWMIWSQLSFVFGAVDCSLSLHDLDLLRSNHLCSFESQISSFCWRDFTYENYMSFFFFSGCSDSRQDSHGLTLTASLDNCTCRWRRRWSGCRAAAVARRWSAESCSRWGQSLNSGARCRRCWSKLG